MSGWLNHYSFKCQPVDYSTSSLAMRVSFIICNPYIINVIVSLYLVAFLDGQHLLVVLHRQVHRVL